MGLQSDHRPRFGMGSESIRRGLGSSESVRNAIEPPPHPGSRMGSESTRRLPPREQKPSGMASDRHLAFGMSSESNRGGRGSSETVRDYIGPPHTVRKPFGISSDHHPRYGNRSGLHRTAIQCSETVGDGIAPPARVREPFGIQHGKSVALEAKVVPSFFFFSRVE